MFNIDNVFMNDEEFFAPSTSDFVDGMIAEYNQRKAQIKQVAEIMRGEHGNAVHYFLTANADRTFTIGKGGLFDEEPAIKALDASYWSKAMHQTNLLDVMPQKRRTEWNEQITKRECPTFEEQTVRATLQDLLSKRHQFFAERVDGIFRNLSGEHVTNSPSGFGKRFILAYMHTDHGNGWYMQNHQRFGYINDLRCVIAKFMGRDEPGYSSSEGLWKALKANFGEWMNVDGNAFKIRLYKKGTAHIEVHPDMAWRLNATLAHLYPSAIPPEFRTKPKTKPKDIVLMQKPLPYGVVGALAELEAGYVTHVDDKLAYRDRVRKITVPNSFMDKHISAAVSEVLVSIGGIKLDGLWRFDYDPMSVIHQIVTSGLVPDDKSHQFYPTPEAVARYAVQEADIKLEHALLEPSAGIGNLADIIAETVELKNIHCVEVSQLRASILEQKGYATRCDDFLKWAEKQPHQKYDRVVMNPPFDRNQWKAHLEHAAPLVKKGGRLVAILPESANGKYYIDGFSCTYPKKFDNEFANTSVTVCVLVADKN